MRNVIKIWSEKISFQILIQRFLIEKYYILLLIKQRLIYSRIYIELVCNSKQIVAIYLEIETSARLRAHQEKKMGKSI